jgi:hypothetical protein
VTPNGAVRGPLVGDRGTGREVRVLEQVERLELAPGAEVDRDHRLAAGLRVPVGELVHADLVRLGGVPGEVATHRPLLLRADAVLPAVAGDEVAARVADRRHAELADQLEHVLPEPLLVGRRVAGLVDAVVDAPPEVLHEGSEDPSIDRADGRSGRDDDAG